MKKNKKMIIAIVVIAIILILGGIFYTQKRHEIQLRESISKVNIITDEKHYIDKSLINMAIEVPFKIEPSISKDKIAIISNNSDIVKVNDDNTITALQIGEADLTLIYKDDKNVTAGLHIVVE